MSAIIWVYTPEGFVVGADGRRKDLTGQIGSDSAQKIFFFETSNTRGAFTWNGCTEISTSSSTFDFKDVTLSILRDIKAERFETLSGVITEIALRLLDPLLNWIQSSGGRLEYPDNEEWASVQMYGYVDGSPDMARAVFPFKGGEPRTPGLDVSCKRLDGTLAVSSGNKIAHQEMVAIGRMQRCNNLVDAKQLVQDYIELCEMSPADTSNNIGGHIHIAAVAPGESIWLILPIN